MFPFLITLNLIYRSEQQPVIYNSYEFVRGQKLGVIKINEKVAEKIASDDLSHTIQARHLPMVVRPRPWSNYQDGGYLYNRSKLELLSFSDGS